MGCSFSWGSSQLAEPPDDSPLPSPSSQPPGSEASNAPALPERLLERFALGPTLGEGTFGVVYTGYDRETGEEVAVKAIEMDQGDALDAQLEAEMLQTLLHDNIVRLRQVFLENSWVSLVMDIYAGGDLLDGANLHVKERGRLNSLQVIHVCAQMAAALQYLHRKSVAHRDVKGDNYLLDRRDITDTQCRVALCDFGTACTLQAGERLSKPVGTKSFWAPEFFAGDYGLQVDIWAMGVTVYGLLAGSYPFKDEFHTRNADLSVPDGVEPACADYLQALLRKDEASRIGAEEAARHPWLRC